MRGSSRLLASCSWSQASASLTRASSRAWIRTSTASVAASVRASAAWSAAIASAVSASSGRAWSSRSRLEMSADTVRRLRTSAWRSCSSPSTTVLVRRSGGAGGAGSGRRSSVAGASLGSRGSCSGSCAGSWRRGILRRGEPLPSCEGVAEYVSLAAVCRGVCAGELSLLALWAGLLSRFVINPGSGPR